MSNITNRPQLFQLIANANLELLQARLHEQRLDILDRRLAQEIEHSISDLARRREVLGLVPADVRRTPQFQMAVDEVESVVAALNARREERAALKAPLARARMQTENHEAALTLLTDRLGQE